MVEKLPDQRFPSWEAVSDELDTLRRAVPPENEQHGKDEIVRLAANRIEAVRSQQLQRQRVEEERRRGEQDRQELLDFWAEEFFGKVRARIDQVNQSLGESAIRFSQPPTAVGNNGKRVCEASFIHARLLITLETLPLDGPEDMILWGAVELTTNGRLWIGNIYSARDPLAYGMWYEVDMHMSAIVRGDSTPDMEDREGGRYKVMGNNRLVLALNWQGLVFQRNMKNTMSLVDYSEKPLVFEAVLEECVRMLVEDAAVEPPKNSGRNQQRVRGPSW